jgi:hypothetical protein
MRRRPNLRRARRIEGDLSFQISNWKLRALSCTVLFVAAAGWCAAPSLYAQTSARPAAIVLPPKLIAEQVATLAVLDERGALLPGAVVEFAGGERVTTDATGRAAFSVPSLTPPVQTGILRAQIPQTAVSETAVVLAPAAGEGPLVLRDAPMLVALTDRFVVNGTGFRAIADDTRVWLGEQPALVLAASPVALVVLADPRTPPGQATLVVEVEGRRTAPHALTLVGIELTTARAQLAPREKGALTVRIRGSEQRLELETRNLSPDVVKLVGGDVQRVVSRGGAENTAVLQLEGRKAGDYSISVRLIPMASGLPDTEAARQKLLAARRAAPGGWGWRVDRVIEKIERHPQNALAARNELERLLALKPGGEFGALLEDAWRILLSLP